MALKANEKLSDDPNVMDTLGRIYYNKWKYWLYSNEGLSDNTKKEF
ncbi:MAG: hypothetical protein SV775_09080 [Thermodesulfobacteriota bacterium]|nr:hypothetical protein [Thermodesulfobacteriota bacterium]